MKQIILLFSFAYCSILSAKTHFVAPLGNDVNAGTLKAPWATWQKAFNTAVAGDTVYFRGGIYYTTTQVYKASGSGTKKDPICFFNYPNEKPILDGIKKTIDAHGIYITGVSYIYFKGLTIRNNFQKTIGSQVQGFLIANCNNITLENCVSHNNGYRGFNLFQTDTAYFYNCDAHHNSDTLSSGPGNGGDGFNFWGYDGNTASYVIVRGCRAWSNSDDGFDTNYDGYVEYDSCWAFNNGNLLAASEGQGFKLGLKENNAVFITRKVSNCIMAFNANTGLITNEDPNDARFVAQAMHIYNNTSYHNGYHPNHPAWGWGYSIVNSYGSSDALELSRIFRNNIAYDNAKNPVLLWPDALYTHEQNSWDIPINVTAADFISIDSTGITGSRQADGSLPDINFLKLSSTSNFLDKGLAVGIPYNGSAPDLGFSEYVSGSVTPSIPEYINSLIGDATPSRLEMTYNLTLANIVPVTSAFTVRVNSSTRSVSSVAISGTKVLLTLSSPVVYGDVVTIAYTKPASNPLQTVSGGQAVSLSAQSVTNNVGPVIPIFISSVIENANPSRLEMTYNLTLANIVPVASAFTVRVNSSTRSVSSVAISGTKVLLTLSSPVVYGDVVTIAYTKPASNPLQTVSGGQAVSLSAQSVTNNVGPVIPIYISSVIENANPSRLEMTYNLTLANIVPVASAFTVRVNSSTRSVSSVAISGTKVLLTLSSPVVYGDVVTIAYTKPASNPLQTVSGGQAVSLSAQSVTNNVGPVIPIFISSVIENANPTRLEMTYNLTLANIVPVASAFTVRVNSSTNSVSSVAISGTKVLLTLSSPVVYGDVVTIAYTKPASNPLQTASGGQSVSLSAQSVTNNVGPVIPVYISSAIESATPSRLEMTYNLTLANIVPVASAFNVRVNYSARSVSSVTILGNKVILILASPVVYDDVVTVAYTKPAINPIQTASGGQAASFSAKSVTNNCRLPENLPPVANLLSPGKSSSFTAPATIVFEVNAYDPDGSINKVEIFNSSIKLAEITTIPYSFTWKDVPEGTYSLTATATDNLNAKTVSDAVTVNVTTMVTSINQLPVVSISSPNDNSSIIAPSTITITADASDSDGTISKVEFYIGTKKIGESFSAPFKVHFECTKAGTYELIAIATDDLSAVTSSSSVKLYATLDPDPVFINLYPNPTDGQFTISMVSASLAEENKLTITDFVGKTVYTGTLRKGENPKQFDLTYLDSGIYIFMISNKEIAFTKKFIKK